jgi:hypothetical protein
MKPKAYLSFFLLFTTYSAFAQTNATDSLLNKLNMVLVDKDVFVKQKQARIDNAKKQLSRIDDPKEKYIIYQQLYDEYKAFSYDSAYNYSKKLQLTANNPERLAFARMELSFTLISSGMF